MQNGIVLMLDILPSIEELTNEDAGAVFKGLLRHAAGRDPDLSGSGIARAVYWLLEGQIDRLATIHEQKARAGKMGGDANAERLRKKQNEADGKHTESRNEADQKQTFAERKQGESPIPKPKPKPKPNSFFDFPQRTDQDLDAIVRAEL